MLDKETYLAMKEVYVNLKNYDFDTFGNYKMDINEAKKFIQTFEKLSCGGWIPADKEHNPKEDGFYIATLDGEIAGEDHPFVGTAEFVGEKWEDDTEDYKCVMAWMPLPQPYKA